MVVSVVVHCVSGFLANHSGTSEIQRELPARDEEVAMMPAAPLAFQRTPVSWGTIASVALPQIPRVPLAERLHQAVARHLRYDGRTRNREAASVAAHDSCVRDRQRANLLSVNQNMIWRQRQATKRAPHRQHCRVIDVDPVDFANGGRTDSDGEGVLPNPHGERDALCGCQLLGVVNSSYGPVTGRHDHSACDNGARKGAPSYLIDTGDESPALTPQISFDLAPAMTAPMATPNAAAVVRHASFSWTRRDGPEPYAP